VVLTHMELADPRAYVRLAAILRQQITDGFLRPGDRAPSITRLSKSIDTYDPRAGRRCACWKARGWLRESPVLAIS